MRLILILLLLVHAFCLDAQFHPPAGESGTSAMHADSSAFVAWASSCIVARGPQQIGIPGSEAVSSGNDTSAIGKAGTAGVVSLGDGGSAVLGFEQAIVNGDGWDFAVFENSFDPRFLELAFVEVSSDGIYYARFPATCLYDSTHSIGSFDLSDAPMYNNLAGKYRVMFGVPFDLEELAFDQGIDINWIKFVRVVDVIGTNQTGFCSRDQYGNPVLDPFPTPFASGGFDLDAVGVIHSSDPNGMEESKNFDVILYPHPAGEFIKIKLNQPLELLGNLVFTDISGRNVTGIHIEKMTETELVADLSQFLPGIYLMRAGLNGQVFTRKFVVN
jgi:hypothetical protein